jgi:hypothetical protein
MDGTDSSPRGKTLQRILEKARKTAARSPEHEIDLAVSGSIYDDLSGARNPKLREDILAYLRNRAKYVPPLDRLVVNVASRGPETPHDLANAVRSATRDAILYAHNELQQIKKLYTILFVLGVLTFVVKTFVTSFFKNAGVNEIFLIIMWVFVWRAVELFFFDRGTIVRESMRLVQLHEARFVAADFSAPEEPWKDAPAVITADRAHAAGTND